MSGIDEDIKSEAGLRKRNRPVVGVSASEESDAVAGTILRARERGHEVLLVAAADRYSESIGFANQLDVTVIQTAGAPEKTEETDELKRVARHHGFPGVIYHPDPTDPLNFEQSRTKLRESETYVVESVSGTKIETEPSVLVAIPTYNEANTIADVVTESLAYADEVLVVDDGSQDETVSVAREAGATVIEHEHNKGYGAALKTAFREAERSNAAHLVILDGDGQHDPSDIGRMIEQQRQTGAELVVGCRFDGDGESNMPLYRRLGLGVVNFLTNISLGVVQPSSRVRDTQNGFRAYNRRAVESLAADETIGDHMGASTDILHHAHSKNYDIEEVGTTVNYDVEDGNSHSPLSHGITLVGNLLTTIERERPLLTLGLPGLLVICIGLGFSYWTISNYIRTAVFPRGLAVTAVFFTLTGVFTVFTGIILHALKQHLRAENINN